MTYDMLLRPLIYVELCLASTQEGVPQKSDLYRNHSFVVKHLWKLKFASDEQQQKHLLL
jgi:hypothetical protein